MYMNEIHVASELRDIRANICFYTKTLTLLLAF